MLFLSRLSRFVLDMFPTLKLPSPILSVSSSELFNLVRLHCGQELLDLLVAQKICDIQTLLRVKDIFTLVHLPTDDFRDLKERVAVQLHDGSWSILIGIQARVNYFMKSLKDHVCFDDDEYDQSSNLASPSDCLTISAELLETFPHLAAVIELCKITNRVPDQNDHFSLISILNNICANLNRSKNNYRHSSYVTHFALSLFICAGRNV